MRQHHCHPRCHPARLPMVALGQVEIALQELPGLENVTVSRGESKGLAYYPADHAATRWYASSHLHKSISVQTFDWLITFTGLVGEQPLLQVGHTNAKEVLYSDAFILTLIPLLLQIQSEAQRSSTM